MKEASLVSLVGLGLGFSLSRIGFSSWDEVHRMFTFTDLRLFLTFVTAVVVLAGGWALIRAFSSPSWAPRLVHRGSLVGGLVFGAGWALSGACPSIALVQLGEGQLAAIFTLGGIFVGNYLYAIVRERWLDWPSVSCVDD